MDPVRIPLSGGRFAVVDAEDYTTLFVAHTYKGKRVEARPCDWSWSISRGTHGEYVKARISGAYIELGRLVMSAPAGLLVDHKDFDPFNNRRTNLRICTYSQNLHARRYKRNATGYRGVQEQGGKFMARIYVDNRDVCLGFYDTAEEAAIARDAKALELFGEFASLNFPKQGAA
jgi:hypothetical protein